MADTDMPFMEEFWKRNYLCFLPTFYQSVTRPKVPQEKTENFRFLLLAACITVGHCIEFNGFYDL